MRSWFLEVRRVLHAPTDVSGLSAFRMLFGFLMAFALLRFGLHGWVQAQWTGPTFHFAYPGLSFVKAGPIEVMHGLFALLVLCAFCIALGIYTRFAAACFAVGFTYVELIDQANYLNHYYLVSLLAVLLSLVPSGRAHSVDVWRRPEVRIDCVPQLCLFVLRAQVLIVYFFAGVAKLNQDWLFHAQPLRIWLSARSDLPWIGPYLAEAWVAYAASWSAAAFDLLVGPCLLSRKARPWAFATAVVFHVATGLLFQIGIFPWLMTACLTLFFEPDWPRRLFASFRPLPPGAVSANPLASDLSGPLPQRTAPMRPWLVVLLVVHLLVQVAVPIVQHRHSDSAWTYRGFNFAWRVMVAEKTGDVTYFVEDRHTGIRRRVRPEAFLTVRQVRALVQDPDLIVDLARHIAHAEARAGRPAAVYADAFASLNGGPTQRLIDPELDLSRPLSKDHVLSRHAPPSEPESASLRLR